MAMQLHNKFQMKNIVSITPLTALNQAKHDLTADTHALEQAVQLKRAGNHW